MNASNLDSWTGAGEKPPEHETYHYDPLPRRQGAIRILQLLPDSNLNAQIQCKLITPVGDETPPYEALSWCWGTPGKTDYVGIYRNDKTLHMKPVSPNLVAAMKALRYGYHSRYLWIDMVCIDQDDLNEKNHQVEMMNIIYGNASRVCIWLGEATESSRMALSFIKDEVLHLQSFDTLCDSQDASRKWIALLDLMQRPWFSRRWVVQELALARKPIIYCGNDRISWKKFAIAVELFVEVETATHRLSEVMKKDRQDQYIPSYFEHVSALGASLLVDATERLFRDWKKVEVRHSRIITDVEYHSADMESDSDSESVKSEDSDSHTPPTTHDEFADSRNRIQPLLSLEYLVSSLTIFDTTVPHDTIYALLAIAKDTTPRALSNSAVVTSRSAQESLEVYTQRKSYNVNYKLPYVDVCKEFIEFSIERSLDVSSSRALDVICRPWAIEERKLRQKREAQQKQQKKERDVKRKEAKLKEQRQAFQTHSSPPQRDVTSSKVATLPVDAAARNRALLEAVQEAAREAASLEAAEKAAQEAAFRREDIRLPSWVPQLSNAPFAMDQGPGTSGPKMSRINADPLVGLPSSTHHNYSAAETRGVDIEALRFRKRSATKQFSMYVRGFKLDIIEEVKQVAHNGQVPIQWADLVEWKDAEKLPPDPFWRTLVANRGKDGKNPPVYYSRACQESFRKGGFGRGAIDTTALIEYERNSVVAQFCRRVQAVTWNRALVHTKTRKLGIVGKDVQKDDLVCILYGCSVPVVLRENPRKSTDVFNEEMEQELLHIGKIVVKTLKQYIARKRQRRRWKEREMAKLCRRWLKTTLFMRSHGIDTDKPPTENRMERLQDLLKMAVTEFRQWRIDERKKAWPKINCLIEAETKERKKYPRKRTKRPGKIEMDQHSQRQTDKQEAEARAEAQARAQARTIRKQQRPESTADLHSASNAPVPTVVTVSESKEASTIDWWEFELALVAGRCWKQEVRQRREKDEKDREQQKLEEYQKRREDAGEVSTVDGTAVEGNDITHEEDAVGVEHAISGLNERDENMANDGQGDNSTSLEARQSHEDNGESSENREHADTEEHDKMMREQSANRDHRDKEDEVSSHDGITPADASPPNPTPPAADALEEKVPRWHHKLNEARLTPDEAKAYDKKVRDNLRERLGEEGYYSYTFLGECYIHGMMDGEAIQYQSEDAEGVVPSMVFEIR